MSRDGSTPADVLLLVHASAHLRAASLLDRPRDEQVEGCDLLRGSENDSIEELVVMVRPLSGALALAERDAGRLTSDNGTEPT